MLFPVVLLVGMSIKMGIILGDLGITEEFFESNRTQNNLNFPIKLFKKMDKCMGQRVGWKRER